MAKDSWTKSSWSLFVWLASCVCLPLFLRQLEIEMNRTLTTFPLSSVSLESYFIHTNTPGCWIIVLGWRKALHLTFSSETKCHMNCILFHPVITHSWWSCWSSTEKKRKRQERCHPSVHPSFWSRKRAKSPDYSPHPKAGSPAYWKVSLGTNGSGPHPTHGSGQKWLNMNFSCFFERAFQWLH